MQMRGRTMWQRCTHVYATRPIHYWCQKTSTQAVRFWFVSTKVTFTPPKAPTKCWSEWEMRLKWWAWAGRKCWTSARRAAKKFSLFRTNTTCGRTAGRESKLGNERLYSNQIFYLHTSPSICSTFCCVTFCRVTSYLYTSSGKCT